MDTIALRRAAERAMLAPSVHNTQPWRVVVGPDHLELHADPTRRLQVLDPRGRQLLQSCGCALLNARASLAASAVGVQVERFPDRRQPNLVARLNGSDDEIETSLAALDDAIPRRRTNRRAFSEEPVPDDVLDDLIRAVERESTVAFRVTRPEHRLAVSRLSRMADEIENADPAYRAELRVWTTTDPRRADGVPAFAVPHVDGSSRDDLPIRDFDSEGIGWLPTQTHSSMQQCLLLLGSYRDDATSWLRGGEGLQRLWLTATNRAFAASLLTQVIEVRRTHEQLRAELNLDMFPHVLLRIGRAPITPPTRRRPSTEVISEAG